VTYRITPVTGHIQLQKAIRDAEKIEKVVSSERVPDSLTQFGFDSSTDLIFLLPHFG
jgi:hypothetical protein